jgi:hypothetical protein
VSQLAILAVLALVVGVGAQVPSDMLTYRDLPTTPVSLSGVSTDSAKAIAATNTPLESFTAWDLPNLGRMSTTTKDGPTSRAVEGTDEQLKFLVVPGPNLTSVGGNGSGLNVTEINGSLAWF